MSTAESPDKAAERTQLRQVLKGQFTPLSASLWAGIFEEAGLPVTVNPMTTGELGRPATRPLYSALDCSKLVKDTGFHPEPWRDALKKYLRLRSEKK